MNSKRDIFDRIMSLPGLRIFYPLYQKYKEVLLYLLFGGLTMIVSIASYWLCSEWMRMNILMANLVSWVAAVSFAYITNRIWVFAQKAHGLQELFQQIFKFFSGRLATLVIEEIILWLFIEKMHFDNMTVKIVGQIVVIVLNYFISKFVVFTKK